MSVLRQAIRSATLLSIECLFRGISRGASVIRCMHLFGFGLVKHSFVDVSTLWRVHRARMVQDDRSLRVLLVRLSLLSSREHFRLVPRAAELLLAATCDGVRYTWCFCCETGPLKRRSVAHF
jgi:hypothetical protein